MPLYDFACHVCGERFEARTGFDDAPPPCPACGADGGEVERVVSGFAGPFTTRPYGLAARRSDATRRGREEQRVERREQRRAEREQRGGAPPR